MNPELIAFLAVALLAGLSGALIGGVAVAEWQEAEALRKAPREWSEE